MNRKKKKRNKHCMQEEVFFLFFKGWWVCERGTKEEKLFTGGLKCETNDFVTLVKPRGGMAAWVITVSSAGR